jgi:hypothetical protein
MIFREQGEEFELCLKCDVVKEAPIRFVPVYRVLFTHHLPALWRVGRANVVTGA